jgi:sulfur relay (sulfurtransferase) DsrC/TusE family protein
MNLTLTDWQVHLLQELLFEELERISDYEELSDEFQDILRQIREYYENKK